MSDRGQTFPFGQITIAWLVNRVYTRLQDSKDSWLLANGRVLSGCLVGSENRLLDLITNRARDKRNGHTAMTFSFHSSVRLIQLIDGSKSHMSTVHCPSSRHQDLMAKLGQFSIPKLVTRVLSFVLNCSFSTVGQTWTLDKKTLTSLLIENVRTVDIHNLMTVAKSWQLSLNSLVNKTNRG